MRGDLRGVGLVLSLLVILLGVAIDGRHLVEKWGAPAPVGFEELRLRELLAYEDRDLDLPIVILTSGFLTQSIEFYFAPSPTKIRFYFPGDEAKRSDEFAPRDRSARYQRWRRVAEEAGFAFDGELDQVLDDGPGYVLVIDLAPDALARVEDSERLELVHTDFTGRGRLYRKR